MSVPSSPAGGGRHSIATTPLQSISHNNQQRDRESTLFSPSQSQRSRGHTLGATTDNGGRDSSVHEKINQFNSLAVQSKQLERKTADAALKRAMLGREEAEADMRRYRDEARTLRRMVKDAEKLVEEGRERERKVGERLETVMESYGRAKETHEHTKELWEKEIRRARKETFKTQSNLVKLQEELKSCRMAQKAADEALQHEKELSTARAKEAFDANCQLLNLQEQLDEALERIKMLEAERDSLKIVAEAREKVRSVSPDAKRRQEDCDEHLAPRKRARTSSISSASTQVPDFDELYRLWQWEKQRADRAVQQVQFLETECQLRICAAGKALRRSTNSSRYSSPRRKRGSLMRKADAGDALILKESPRASPEPPAPTPKRSKTDLLREDIEERHSLFRPPVRSDKQSFRFSRTPSIEPPDLALSGLDKDRTSLLSLLDAPHQDDSLAPVFNIPTMPGPDPTVQAQVKREDEEEQKPVVAPAAPPPGKRPAPILTSTTNLPREDSYSPALSALSVPHSEPPLNNSSVANPIEAPPLVPRPHTSTSHYRTNITTTVKTTTTKVPLKEENQDPNLAQRLMKLQRTPSRNGGGDNDWDKPSFDVNNPALTPTMTREQALEQIKERRGRARSVGRPGTSGNGGPTKTVARKVSVETGLRDATSRERGRTKDRREISNQSAPTGNGGSGTLNTLRQVTAGLSSTRRVRS
ncbi:hypothetical protein QBC35DRAFT_387710 [Podospora australis]|uniref:Uncharacterized protein n=1 Tax=Podospora australis TaxID=1536484 RepID=A0AAN6WRS5_9PEZI|nr:hypothetical protein QBC35DRAFT_387710 [Podospora australis]